MSPLSLSLTFFIYLSFFISLSLSWGIILFDYNLECLDGLDAHSGHEHWFGVQAQFVRHQEKEKEEEEEIVFKGFIRWKHDHNKLK